MKTCWLFLLTATSCSSSQASDPRPPATSPGPVAGSAVRELRGVPMAGPSPTLAAACAALDPCSSHVEEAGVPLLATRTAPDCALVLGTTPDVHAPDRLRHEGGDHEVVIAPLRCDVNGTRYDHHRYFAFVHRPDGWWRSGPLFEADVNNRYCSAEIMATWEQHDELTFARVTASHNCVACDKQGRHDDELRLLVGVDPAGAAPAAWTPLLVGEHNNQTPLTLDPTCTTVDEKVVLSETWRPGGLELAGPATWHPQWTERGIPAISIDETTQAPSPIGAYHFTR